jgi:hypothetical protein
MDNQAAGWLLALAMAGLLWPLSAPGRRPYATAAIALLLLYLVALAMSATLLEPALRPWSSAIAAAAVWLVIQPLIALGRMSTAELGLSPPRAGSLRPAIVVMLLALVANAAISALSGASPVGLTLALVSASMIAAVMEELVMRGALLALADRASPPRWTRRPARPEAGAAARRGAGRDALSLAARADGQPGSSHRRAPAVEWLGAAAARLRSIF